MEKKSSNVLRNIAIIFMGLTAAMNLLGGIGTVCAAFLTKDYPPMWDLYDYQWLYQSLMITTIITGIFGIWVTVKLVKGGEKVYRNTLIVLIIGTLLGGTQYFASLALRGKAVPANMKFYINLVTLILFLVLKLPGVREKVDFSKGGGDSGKTAGGVAAILAGVVTLTTFYWVGPSHTYMGANWVEVLDISLILLGSSLFLLGLGTVGSVVLGKIRQMISKSAADSIDV